MKTLTADYQAKVTVLAQAAKALQKRHNDLAQLIVAGVEAEDIGKLRAARANLADATSHFNGVVDQIGDLVASEKAFEAAAHG